MSETAEFVYVIDSPFEAGLIRSLEEVRKAGCPDALVTWLVSYHAGELRLGTLVSDRAERFRKVGGAYLRFYRSYRVSTLYRAEKAAREYLFGMETALAKIIAIDEGIEEDEDELRKLLRDQEFEKLAARVAALGDSDGENGSERYLRGYRRRLRDNGFLTEEYHRVLAAEYSRRVEPCRARFFEHTEPLRLASEGLRSQIAEIDRTLDELSRDESVTPHDKRVFLDTFVKRRSELLNSSRSLQAKALLLAEVLGECRSATERFANRLLQVQRQLTQYAARRDYLRRLESIGSEVPELPEILDNVADAVRSNAAVVQETFLLLNEDFENELLSVVDSDRVLRTVTVTVQDAPEVSLAISAPREAGESPVVLDLASFASLAAYTDRDDGDSQAWTRARRSIRPAGDATAGLMNGPF